MQGFDGTHDFDNMIEGGRFHELSMSPETRVSVERVIAEATRNYYDKHVKFLAFFAVFVSVVMVCI